MSKKPSSPGKTANPCRECTIGQDCCANRGLMKTSGEPWPELLEGLRRAHLLVSGSE